MPWAQALVMERQPRGSTRVMSREMNAGPFRFTSDVLRSTSVAWWVSARTIWKSGFDSHYGHWVICKYLVQGCV